MKTYMNIEEFKNIDDLLDHAEFLCGPGTFVMIGRMGKRNVGAFDQVFAEDGEQVSWPCDRVLDVYSDRRPHSARLRHAAPRTLPSPPHASVRR